MDLNINGNGASERFGLADFMNIFQDFNNLWHDDNSFNDLFEDLRNFNDFFYGCVNWN